MSDSEDAKDYTANGPTDAGFRTGGDGTGIKNGVFVAGKEIGVSGTSLGTGDGSFFAGLAGEGPAFGVHGHSQNGIGVFGRSEAANGVEGHCIGTLGIGVKGFGFVAVEGESTNGTGVKGFDRQTGTGVEGNSDSGLGVRGTSSSGDGVVGSSVGLRKSGVFGFNSRENGAAFGVSGSCDSADGAGVNGFSEAGVGVFGDSASQSGVVGRSRGTAAPGVFGFCEKLTGVAGRSTDAPGVFGDSVKQAGVMGRSGSISAPGVFGFGNAPFKVPSPPSGVLGVNDKSVGVMGSSVEVIGVWGNTAKGIAVVGTTDFGAGLPTDQITDQGIGVIGLTNSGVGVAGMATSGTGVFGSSATGLAGHFKGPVTIEGDLTIVGGAKSAAVPHPDGSHRQLYCIESPESWFEDFGEARLVDGKAEVRLEPGFAALIKLKNYQVFLTPYGDCKGMFVTKRAATGFRVTEQQGGSSNVRFAYRVVAKRKDVVARRLAIVTVPDVSRKVRSPKLRLKISLPDFERLSINPLDLPSAETSQ
jgi:hypothetical protein